VPSPLSLDGPLERPAVRRGGHIPPAKAGGVGRIAKSVPAARGCVKEILPGSWVAMTSSGLESMTIQPVAAMVTGPWFTSSRQ